MKEASIPHWSLKEFADRADALRRPYQSHYYAMYSSLWGGIVTDPVLMVVPIDDHMVHRGDGVFEALKCVRGSLYNLMAHLDRLDHSASGLNLSLPFSRTELIRTLCDTVRAGGKADAMVRIFLARGPGGFSVNPYESPAQQVYIVVTEMGRPFMELHPEGARVRASAIPAKSGLLATTKSCNYVPNVLMKKEAVDARIDFVVGFDEHHHMTEGATENMGIVTSARELLFPRLSGVMPGTTMLRVMELARTLIPRGLLSSVAFDDIAREEVINARELLITGTTVNVTAGVEFDGRPIGEGKLGPVQQALDELLRQDMLSNASLLTPTFTG